MAAHDLAPARCQRVRVRTLTRSEMSSMGAVPAGRMLVLTTTETTRVLRAGSSIRLAANLATDTTLLSAYLLPVEIDGTENG